MAGQDANGNMPEHLNVDGGAVKEPLKPKAGGKAGPTQPGYDPNSMVGTVLESYEDADIPFFWFHSIGQAWRWFTQWAIPGLGMFCEAYFIFSIGNIRPIITAEYPNCWKNYSECTKTLTQAPDYTQIIGIILETCVLSAFRHGIGRRKDPINTAAIIISSAITLVTVISIIMGMCLLGAIGDKIGRRKGSITTACIMIFGAIMLTVNNGITSRGFTIMFMISQFIFGFGVGGEYPMAAGSAAERAEAGGAAMAKKRGREVVLTFSMQGVGNFVNTSVLIVLLVIFQCAVPNHSNKLYPYHPNLLSGVWRTAFGLGLIPLVFILFWRLFRLRESAVWAANQTNRNRGKETGLLFRHFWHRLLATCGGWFLWDFSFYGNKVFQSSFIQVLSPGASLLTTLLWTLLNSGCALIGYYFSAALVDNPLVGRNRIQIFGFIGVGVLFMVSAGAYGPLTTEGGIGTFQFIYFFSSFVGQFGPNCTTFLLAGELYPTQVRTTAHGMSAGFAKCGALWASVWFNYLGGRQKFWLTASFNFGGALLTALFMPDPLRLSLAELDRRFKFISEGRTYHGEAINPKNLSIWEKMMRVGRNYDPQLNAADMQQENVPQWRRESLARQTSGAPPHNAV